jgi:hypothetical protein
VAWFKPQAGKHLTHFVGRFWHIVSDVAWQVWDHFDVECRRAFLVCRLSSIDPAGQKRTSAPRVYCPWVNQGVMHTVGSKTNVDATSQERTSTRSAIVYMEGAVECARYERRRVNLARCAIVCGSMPEGAAGI